MRTIKFRGISLDTGKWIYGYPCFDSSKQNAAIINKHGNNEMQHHGVIPETIGEFTGLIDKHGIEIYEDDIIRFRRPYRTTQTHTGDNIPNGSYTEPMEPGIETIEEVVRFIEGTFTIQDTDYKAPISWYYQLPLYR